MFPQITHTTRLYFARRLLLTSQRPFLSSTSSRHISTFPPLRNPKQPPLRPAGIDRACGAPLDSTEAGPPSPAGILRPEAWIIGAGAILTMAGLYFFIPSSSSFSGQARQKNILGQRQALERHEGDREEEETDAEKAEEAEMIRIQRGRKG